MQQIIFPLVLEQAISFEEYVQLTKDILEERIPREGIYVNDSTFRYTRSNLDRMNKVLQNIVVNQKLYNLLSETKEDWIWVVLSEPWCGDASWGTPALYVLSTCSDRIDFKILLRDKHPDVMQHYQTEGTDSIPKLVCLRNRDMEVLFTWGPRPVELQNLVNHFKGNALFDYRESVRMLHRWYEEDMAKSIQEELTDILKSFQQ
ncbi:MAG: thioredoxin family protein [Chitinophagales bacterium]|nr:thioredoxin family protein [Chitinophagales bacterium]